MSEFKFGFTPTQDQLEDPERAFVQGDPLVKYLGIEVNPLEDPAEYYRQVRAANPRSGATPEEDKTRDEIVAVVKGEPKTLRQLKKDVAIVLGLTATEYPFNGHRVDDVVIVPAKSVAWEARATAALEALKDDSKLQVAGDIWIPGSSKPGEARAAALLVTRFREKYEDVLKATGVGIGTFMVENPKAKTEHYTSALIDKRREAGTFVGSLAAIAQSIYVPSMTFKNKEAAEPKGVDVVTIGIASDPEIVKARGPETYFIETLPVMTSAARYQQVRDKRGQ